MTSRDDKGYADALKLLDRVLMCFVVEANPDSETSTVKMSWAFRSEIRDFLRAAETAPSHEQQNAAPAGEIARKQDGVLAHRSTPPAGAAPSTTRRSDCPLENCEKTSQCEFPQDCDAPSPATPRSGETPITDAAGLWLMAEGPLPADWKCPPGQEADIRQFDHELLGPCTEWKVVTAAIARRLERAASPVSATPQKPVAWRYKPEPTADWRHLGFPPAGVGSDAVVEPLYAAPCSEPVAWAVVTSDGDPREANSIHWPATCRHVHDGDAKAAAQAWADRFGYSIVPLYATDGGVYHPNLDGPAEPVGLAMDDVFHPFCNLCGKAAPSSGGCASENCGIRRVDRTAKEE